MILMRVLSLAAAALILSACQQVSHTAAAPEEKPETAAVEVRKSPNDQREYRYLTLPNKLRVLLVSDADTEQAAAAMAVYRGSFHEPEDRPGLAHFLEHMLFIQTETYPEVDGFQKYISANGGSSNAYTSLDHTNYFFSVLPDALPEALDRWGHFFIDPTLSADYALREKNAVHSEYQMQMKDDGWRGYMVAKQALNPAHPGSQFTIGSLDTLAGDIQADLQTFFDTQYSADQMGLVVLSDQSLDELQSLVSSIFSQIENKDIGPAYVSTPMYTEDQLPQLVANKTEKAGAKLSLSFPMPSTMAHYRKKPEQYIANLLGHEGAGSLHAFLKAQGWIESLSAGVSPFDRGTSVLNISTGLTPLGDANRDAIVSAIFKYIEMLQSEPPRQWLYEEQATVAELGFRYQEKSSPTGLVYQLAPRLDHYPAADILVAPYLMEQFDADLIGTYLKHLRKDNVVVEYQSPDAETDAVEPWFNVPYRIAPIELPTAPVAVSFRLPEPNPFMPEDLALIPHDAAPPVHTRTNGMDIWTDLHTDFGTPRANQRIALAVPGGLVSASDRAMAQLYRIMVSDSLSELTYPAYLAGLGYSYGVLDGGFEIRIGGYADKQHALLNQVTDALFNAPLAEDRFEILKASLIKDWRNSTKQRPYRQAMSAVSETLQTGRYAQIELADALQDVSLQELLTWRQKHLANLGVTALLQGNVDADYFNITRTVLKRHVPVADVELHRATAIPIDERRSVKLDIDHNDATFVMHLPRGSDAYTERAASALAAQMLRPEYFRLLRTEQQLGYVVQATNRPIIDGHAGITFVVQSPVASPRAIQDATAGFLETFIAQNQSLTAEDLAEHKAGLINRLLEKPKNLGELTGRVWADILEGNPSLDTRERIAEAVRNLSVQDMQTFFAGLKQGFENRHLLVYSTGRFEDIPAS